MPHPPRTERARAHAQAHAIFSLPQQADQQMGSGRHRCDGRALCVVDETKVTRGRRHSTALMLMIAAGSGGRVTRRALFCWCFGVF